jgi:hypothetical protein
VTSHTPPIRTPDQPPRSILSVYCTVLYHVADHLSQSTSAPRLIPRLAPLEERIGPPPADVAPLDQFREALLLTNEVDGLPPSAYTLQLTNAELLQLYRHEVNGGYHEQNICSMVDRGGWAKADAVLVRLLLSFVARGIGLAVCERRTAAAAICHGVHASIARVGEHTASPAPDLFLPAQGLSDLGLRHGLFYYEPLAAAFSSIDTATCTRCGSGGTRPNTPAAGGRTRRATGSWKRSCRA